jgi:hypothetical protein
MTSREIHKVQGTVFGSHEAKWVEADPSDATDQWWKTDDSVGPLRSRAVEADPTIAPRARSVEEDLRKKQIEATVAAPKELTIRRVGATRTVPGSTVIDNTPAWTAALFGLPYLTPCPTRHTEINHGRRPSIYVS